MVHGAGRMRERKRREMEVGAEANFIRNFSFILSFLLFCWPEPGSPCEEWLQGCPPLGLMESECMQSFPHCNENPIYVFPEKEL
jgi:hypothetical protein